MKNLFDASSFAELKERIGALRADSPRQWGKMTAAQAMAHCASAMETATGDQQPPRLFIGRVLGPLVKRKAIHSDDPMRRNAPTDPRLVVADDRSLEREQHRLIGLMERFNAGGAARCTTHPHSFFGPLTPEEWARLMYKHIDHHLRQFGA
jgi:hypothetical protein